MEDVNVGSLDPMVLCFVPSVIRNKEKLCLTVVVIMEEFFVPRF